MVVNCSGLGAIELVGDQTLIPIRGQVLRVTNPGLSRFVRDDTNPDGRTYIYPRGDDCILGGSSEPGNTRLDPDPAITARILRNCVRLQPNLRESELLDELVGLRPWRSEVRLELSSSGAHSAPVVHNYGHGGAGVTLAWGCAAEVVLLAAQTLA